MQIYNARLSNDLVVAIKKLSPNAFRGFCTHQATESFSVNHIKKHHWHRDGNPNQVSPFLRTSLLALVATHRVALSQVLNHLFFYRSLLQELIVDSKTRCLIILNLLIYLPLRII